jgi:DNA-binding GntR family transcriptional regulator
MNEIRSIKTLREKVYAHLKTMIKARKLSPWEFIDLGRICGAMLGPLDPRTIRNIFEIVGALENTALLYAGESLSADDIVLMAELDA